MIIKSPDLNLSLKDRTIYESKSLPPVEPFTFNIIAVPIPIIIPPYMHAKNLSVVIAGKCSKIFKNIDKKIVPAIDLMIKDLPTLKNARINNGIFKIQKLLSWFVFLNLSAKN